MEGVILSDGKVLQGMHEWGVKMCSDDIPPQMNILNMVIIPILMHFCSFVSNWSIANMFLKGYPLEAKTAPKNLN